MMKTLGTLLVSLLLAPLLCGCDSLFHGFSVLPPEEPYRPPITKSIDSVLARPRAGDPAVYPLLADAPRSSVDLVIVKDRISPRYHERSDLTLFVLEGEGDLLLERQWKRVGAGTLVHVPMNVAYGYVNKTEGGSRLILTHTPPNIKGDEVELQEQERQ